MEDDAVGYTGPIEAQPGSPSLSAIRGDISILCVQSAKANKIELYVLEHYRGEYQITVAGIEKRLYARINSSGWSMLGS